MYFKYFLIGVYLIESGLALADDSHPAGRQLFRFTLGVLMALGCAFFLH
jgi:hypothetical protein